MKIKGDNMFFKDKKEYEDYLSKNQVSISNENTQKYFSWSEDGEILIENSILRKSTIDVDNYTNCLDWNMLKDNETMVLLKRPFGDIYRGLSIDDYYIAIYNNILLPQIAKQLGNESAKYWLSILNGLKNRGVEDILITCIDGLTGFPEAISAVYPKAEIQQCVIHQIRNSTRYVSYKDIKALMADLKKVYAAIDEETALYELDNFAEKWDSKYPKISISWRNHWAELSTYFKYPQSVRTLIYTTNSIENFNRQLRKVTKSKAVFPNDDSLMKMLYLATMDITKKWTGC